MSQLPRHKMTSGGQKEGTQPVYLETGSQRHHLELCRGLGTFESAQPLSGPVSSFGKTEVLAGDGEVRG